MKNEIFKENGISLVVLVITIIVLAILGGVALYKATGAEGMIIEANNTVNQYNNSILTPEELVAPFEKK